jgi:hypothetical protein
MCQQGLQGLGIENNASHSHHHFQEWLITKFYIIKINVNTPQIVLKIPPLQTCAHNKQGKFYHHDTRLAILRLLTINMATFRRSAKMALSAPHYLALHAKAQMMNFLQFQIFLPCCSTQRSPKATIYIHPFAIKKKKDKTIMHKYYISLCAKELKVLLKSQHTQHQQILLVILQLLTVNSTYSENCNSSSKNMSSINDKSGLLPSSQKSATWIQIMTTLVDSL